MRVKWSQNFLADTEAAHRIVACMDLSPEGRVIEIGPGRGVLTRILLKKPVRLTAVEIDPGLSDLLEERFGGSRNFTLVRGDFLEADLRDPAFGPGGAQLIGNLPYAVVSPIVQKVLAWSGWDDGVFMVQKEVGERMAALPGGKDYGVLSVSVQSRCRIRHLFDVPRRCFRPVPKVENSVIRLERLSEPLFDPAREKEFFSVVRGGFAHRRKTILNSLGYALEAPETKVRSALKAVGIPETARAETLSIAEFGRLAEEIYAG